MFQNYRNIRLFFCTGLFSMLNIVVALQFSDAVGLT